MGYTPLTLRSLKVLGPTIHTIHIHLTLLQQQLDNHPMASPSSLM